MVDRNSLSPSPRKSRSATLPSVNLEGEVNFEDEDDEETLQLKLQELQAKLKLKRLQNAKANAANAPKEEGMAEARARTAELSTTTYQPEGRRWSVREGTPESNIPIRNPVQVPASPVRKTQAPQEQRSPRRVELGIDKGLKACDISLKRAPSLRRNTTSQDGPLHEGYLRRSRTPNFAASSPDLSRPQSFSERLTSIRAEDATRVERQERLQKSRSQGFCLGKDEMEKYKKTAVDIPYEAPKTPSFSREEVMGQGTPANRIRRSNTTGALRSAKEADPFTQSTTGQAKEEEQGASFEPYSSFHLSRRILPHTVLARHLSGKKAYNIKDVLRHVKAPDFSLPDIEQDIVIFGIIAKKSDPRAHKPVAAKNGVKQEDRGKYMVMTLVDLEWELDLFLFNSGFTRFWKLTEGTVVAILNPNIMPPPPGRQDTGRFSLVINSDDDTIIEIGSARDLGACQTIRKDGDLCGSWVNRRRTQFCEFHTNEAIKKTRANRVEMNGAGFGDVRSKSKVKKDLDAKKKAPGGYDWETKTRFFATRSMSAADLIDGKDRTMGEKKEREEALQRRMEAKEKERELMKKLGQMGNGAGKEYLQRTLLSNGDKHKSSNSISNGRSLKPSTSSSQLAPGSEGDPSDPLNLNGRERNIHLSPINKRKRADSSQGGSGASSSSHTARPSTATAGLGWGSGLREKLGRMKEGEKLRPEEVLQPPVRKKTRFVTDKGIREAGRESLGTELNEMQISLDDDDDDELVILR